MSYSHSWSVQGADIAPGSKVAPEEGNANWERVETRGKGGMGILYLR